MCICGCLWTSLSEILIILLTICQKSGLFSSKNLAKLTYNTSMFHDINTSHVKRHLRTLLTSLSSTKILKSESKNQFPKAKNYTLIASFAQPLKPLYWFQKGNARKDLHTMTYEPPKILKMVHHNQILNRTQI